MFYCMNISSFNSWNFASHYYIMDRHQSLRFLSHSLPIILSSSFFSSQTNILLCFPPFKLILLTIESLFSPMWIVKLSIECHKFLETLMFSAVHAACTMFNVQCSMSNVQFSDAMPKCNPQFNVDESKHLIHNVSLEQFGQFCSKYKWPFRLSLW